MSEGFAFDFDATTPAQTVGPVPVLVQPELHPLGATLLREVLEANGASASGVEFNELVVHDKESGAEADDEHRSLMHVVGVRDSSLQAAYDGAQDDEDEEAAAAVEMRDMVPGQYLGGLKVWSCATDLARAVFHAGSSPNIPAELPAGATPKLALAIALRQCMSSTAARVLELGCGHGLPGMAALACGALDVSFHDFNQEVIERCLLPNLVGTFGDNLKRLAVARRRHLVSFGADAKVRAGSGAWSSLAPAEPETATPLLFDAILGADVTYDDAATAEVIATIARLLAPGGMAFIATKVYYFGTGGGVRAIEAAVAQVPSLSIVLDVSVHAEGDSMPRSIIAVQRSHNPE